MPQPNTDISRGKTATWFWSFYNHNRLPVEGLGQIWGGWQDRGQSLQKTTGIVFTPRVKCIDCRQTHLHPYLWKHRCPFCQEAQFWWRRVQNGEGHEWVGWQGATGSEKKKMLLCKPDGFLWIKMSKWWKKEDVHRQYERENKIEKLSRQAPQAKQCPWGGRREHFCLIPDNQQTRG